MVERRDQVITYASLVLALSGAILGALSLAAILLWGAGGDDQESGMIHTPEVRSTPPSLEPSRGDKHDPRSVPPLGPSVGQTPHQPIPPGSGASGPTLATQEDLAGRAMESTHSRSLKPQESGDEQRQAASENLRLDPGSAAERLSADPASKQALAAQETEIEKPSVVDEIRLASEETPTPDVDAAAEASPSVEPPEVKVSKQTGQPPAAASRQRSGEGESPAMATAPPVTPHPETKTEPAKVTPRLRQSDWILDQDPQAYTIQIMAVSDVNDLKRFVEQGSMEMELAYYQTQRKGAQWYILIAGLFPDLGTATKALLELPKSVQRNSPWVRSLRSVQKQLNGTQAASP